MKVITPGHCYEATNFENKEQGQIIQFIEKQEVSDPATSAKSFVTVNDGTSNEELIDVLVDRLTYLNGKCPCRENALAITHLQEAQNWLYRRTRDREKRGVEGTPKA